MQRNITYQITVKSYLWAIALIGYSFFIPIYPYLPPLVALVVYAAYITRSWLWIATAVVYLILFEADRGYLFLSEGVIVFVWWYIAFPFFSQKVICKLCLPIGGIVIFYALHTLIMNLLSVVFRIDYTVDILLTCYYLVIDALFAIILFG